jgi:hypothetical protein
MELPSTPDIFAQDNTPPQNIESNNKHEHQVMFPSPMAEFEYNGRPYLMTSSFGGRIILSTITNHIEPNTIYSGFIDGVSYQPEQQEDLQYFIFRGEEFLTIDSNCEEFGVIRTAMETYRDTPVVSGRHEGWDRAIENSKRNIAEALESLKDPIGY